MAQRESEREGATGLAASGDGGRLDVQAPAPLGRRLADGRRLVRPPEIEQEIRRALELDEWTLARRAAIREPSAEGYLSSECLVHLARRDIAGERRLVEALVPPLLRRCEGNLRRTVSGPSAEEVREDILGRLALLLVEPGDGADFFEVRFDLALKRLRIDVCRFYGRRPRGQSIDGEDPPVEADVLERALGEHHRHELPAETRAMLHQALESLEDDQRRAVVLRYLVGLPVASQQPDKPTVATALGVSERTVRNLLLRARRRLAAVGDGRRPAEERDKEKSR